MNKEQWLALFDTTNENFKWIFIDNGFDAEWDLLMEHRKKGYWHLMKKVMDDTWFYVHSDLADIIDESPGINEFFALIGE